MKERKKEDIGGEKRKGISDVTCESSMEHLETSGKPRLAMSRSSLPIESRS